MKKFVLICLSVFTIASCNKDDANLSKTEMIRDGEWTLNSYKLLYYDRFREKDSIYDIKSSFPDCKKDDRFKFNNNYFGIQKINSVCNATDAAEIPFEWEMTNNETGMRIHHAEYTFGYEYIQADILRFEANRVNLRFYDRSMDVDLDKVTDTLIYSIELTK